jgi:hypothetical protein
VEREVVEEAELSVGQVCHELADARLPAREVELEPPRVDDVAVEVSRGVPELDSHARDQLVERERLGDVVLRAELEAPQLRRQVGARGEDDDGELGVVVPRSRGR